MGGLCGWPLPFLKPGATWDASGQHGRLGSGGDDGSDDGGDHDGDDGDDDGGGGDSPEVKIRILRRISRWRSTGRCLQWHDQRQILMFLSSQGKESPKN